MITSVSPVTRGTSGSFSCGWLSSGWCCSPGVRPGRLTFTAPFQWSRWPLAVLWVAVFVSMAAQLDPNSRLTAGCMKQYPARFDPVPGYDPAALSWPSGAEPGGGQGSPGLAGGQSGHRRPVPPEGAVRRRPDRPVRPGLSVRPGVRAVFLPLPDLPHGQPVLRQLPHLCLGLLDDGRSAHVRPHWYSWSLFGMGLAVLACGSGGTPGTRSGSGRAPTACSSAPTARSSCAGTNFPAPPNSAEDTICARRHCRRARFPSL